MNQKILVDVKEIVRIMKHDWIDFQKIKKVVSGKELSFYEGMKTAEEHFKSKVFRLADYFEKVFQEHRKEAVVTCMESCWCWDWSKSKFLKRCGVEE